MRPTKEKTSVPGKGIEAREESSTAAEYSTRLTTFLPLDLSDFGVKDDALDEVDHIVFLRLVRHYWLTAAPLPTADAKLARIARLSGTEWRRHRETILPCFDETPIGFEPKVYREALQRAREVSEKRREAGRKGGKISGGKRQADTDTDTDTVEDLPSSAARGPAFAAPAADFASPAQPAAVRVGGAV